ncbi:phosphotransferase [Actinopolymorpha sp. B17G11]|uniref:phosphotransferase family protein n=1 Tax=unclassified Actinopolymorpha TaxID=2627063 RepID=UPI0032D9A009
MGSGEQNPVRLPHGYTNFTRVEGMVVVKTYAGPDADLRRDRERTALTRLAGLLPVPPLIDGDATSVRVGHLPGVHGQELLAPDVDSATATAVLAACGDTLRRLHEVVPGPLVHGDYGPNNLLFDPETFVVTAILDWEFSHAGDPIEDLAWCEWIVRTHQPDRVPLLDAFFSAYGGDVPGWATRQAAMIARCRELLDFCHRWDPDGAGVTLWKHRLAETSTWPM